MKTNYLSHVTEGGREILEQLTEAGIDHCRIGINDESFGLLITSTQEQTHQLLDIMKNSQLRQLSVHDNDERPPYPGII